MTAFFPRPSIPAFRPGQSTPAPPKRFGVLKDKAVSPDEAPEIQRVVCNSFRVFIDLNLLTSHQMESDIKNLRTPSKKASFWKPSHDDESSPQVCILYTLHHCDSSERWKANLRKAKTYVTQSIRITHTMQNVQTSRTTETYQTAPPVRKGLIDIVTSV
jgi:hypothetical protein